MDSFDLPRRLAAEALGTGILVATVVGSGVMAETLTKDLALALLCNTLPTGAILVVLITVLGPISGAHFNPAVTLVFTGRRELPVREAGLYVIAQIAGGITGTIVAHLMFALPLIDFSLKARSGGAQWFAEAVAALLMVGTIAGILMATFLNNSGGAWDNAKKFIETGALGGKGSETHKAAVVGDTVGDPFKDTAGPSLHVLIKLLSTITLVLAPLFV